MGVAGYAIFNNHLSLNQMKVYSSNLDDKRLDECLSITTLKEVKIRFRMTFQEFFERSREYNEGEIEDILYFFPLIEDVRSFLETEIIPDNWCSDCGNMDCICLFDDMHPTYDVLNKQFKQ